MKNLLPFAFILLVFATCGKSDKQPSTPSEPLQTPGISIGGQGTTHEPRERTPMLHSGTPKPFVIPLTATKACWVNTAIFRTEEGPDGDIYLVNDGDVYLNRRVVEYLAQSDSMADANPYLYEYCRAAVAMMKERRVGEIDIDAWLDRNVAGSHRLWTQYHSHVTYVDETFQPFHSFFGQIETPIYISESVDSTKILDIEDVLFLWDGDTISTSLFDRFLIAADYSDSTERRQMKSQFLGIAARYLIAGDPEEGIKKADAFLAKATGALDIGTYARFYKLSKQ